MKFRKIDLILMLAILAVSLVVKLSAFNTVLLAGDSVSFAALAENIKNGAGYTMNGLPHLHWPPLFPFFIALTDMIFDNVAISIKFISIVFSTLTLVIVYLLSRRFGINAFYSAFAALLVLFNPFFLYYAGGVMPLSESLVVFLITLAFYFYTFDKKGMLLSGVFFGLATLTKLNYIVIVLPLVIVHVFHILKKINFKTIFSAKNFLAELRNNLTECLFIIMSVSPLMLWVLRNKLVSSHIAAPEFFDFASRSHLFNIPYVAFAYLLGFLVLALPFLLFILFYFGFTKKSTSSSALSGKSDCCASICFADKFCKFYKFWRTFFFSVLFYFLFIIIFNSYYSNNLISYSISRSRFFVWIMPLLTIFCILLLSKTGINIMVKSKINTKINTRTDLFNCRALARILMLYIVGVLIVFVAASFALTNGFVASRLNISAPGMSSTFVERSYHRSESIDWANSNLPYGSALFVYFNEDKYGMQGTDVFYPLYFREDLNVIALKESSDHVLYTDVISLKDLPYHYMDNTYILTDESLQDIILAFDDAYTPKDAISSFAFESIGSAGDDHIYLYYMHKILKTNLNLKLSGG